MRSLLCLFKIIAFLSHQVIHAFVFHVRENVHVRAVAAVLAHIAQGLESYGLVRGRARDLVAVETVDNDNRIRPHVTRRELVAAVIGCNVTGKVTVGLLQRFAVVQLVQEHSRALEERPFLRVTRQRVERDLRFVQVRYRSIGGRPIGT